MQVNYDDNVSMDYFAHESKIINGYLRLLCKAFRGHKPNECLLSSVEFIDRVTFNDKLTTEESESLKAAYNFIMLRIKVVFKEKNENVARKTIKNTTKKNVGKMAARSATNC